MTTEKLTVFGVGLAESTAGVVESICLRSGLEFVRHTIPETFALRDDLAAPGVVLASLPERPEGVRLQADRLQRRTSPLTVVYLAEQLHLRTVVEALRTGAEEVLQWPAETDRLEPVLSHAAESSLQKQGQIVECRQAREKLERLSLGEREVLELMLAGKVNKLVAARLGIALRTVENRRKQIFTKLGTRGFADIVRLVQNADRLLRVDLPQLPEAPTTIKLERAS